MCWKNDEIGGTYLVKNETKAIKLNETSEICECDDNESDNFTDYMNQNSAESACESSADCSQTQLIKFEYHVLYHISYAVPYLCFNAYKSSRFSYVNQR